MQHLLLFLLTKNGKFVKFLAGSINLLYVWVLIYTVVGVTLIYLEFVTNLPVPFYRCFNSQHALFAKFMFTRLSFINQCLFLENILRVSGGGVGNHWLWWC